MKHQKYDALIFMIYLEKYLKKIQKSFQKIDILEYMKNFMKVVKGCILIEI